MPEVRLRRWRPGESRSEDDNLASLRLANRLGAERREPVRVKVDRRGIPRTLVVHVLAVR